MENIKKYRRRVELFFARRMASFGFLSYSIANAATAPDDIISSKDKVVALACAAMGWMFWGLIVLSVIMFLVGGYTYATANGESEKVGKANKTLLYAAVAIVVALLAKGVPVIIGSFFKVSTNLNAC